MARRDRGRWNVPPAGETLPLHLDSLSHQGAAIGRRDGQVVFAAFGIPGEDVDVLIERVHKDYLEGHVTGVHTPSELRVVPRCEYFGLCGGCQLQHIAYEGQLELKRRIVAEQLRRIGKLTDIDVRPTLPSPEPWHYRNHARFSVDREGYLGFTLRGRKRVVRTMTCYIVHPWIRDTMQKLQGRVPGLRQVAMRVGRHTGDTLIQPPLGEGGRTKGVVVDALSSADPLLEVTIGPDIEGGEGASSTPGRDFDDPPPESERAHAGKEPENEPGGSALPLPFGAEPLPPSGQRGLTEALLGVPFQVSAASFFQVNTLQAENLIRLVRDGLALTADDILLDAYAGVGTFARTLAPLVRRVIAIEVSASSVRDGRLNTADMPNIEWIEDEVERALPNLLGRPTAVVLDPSRQGCGVPALDTLIEARVPRLAYVSCEPATLARDLRHLVDGGYRIDLVQPVDMFPQTYHIECVAILRRDEG